MTPSTTPSLRRGMRFGVPCDRSARATGCPAEGRLVVSIARSQVPARVRGRVVEGSEEGSPRRRDRTESHGTTYDEQGRISEMDHELKHALESDPTTRWDQAYADAVRVANERYESEEYYDTGDGGRSRTHGGLYRSAFRMEKT